LFSGISQADGTFSHESLRGRLFEYGIISEEEVEPLNKSQISSWLTHEVTPAAHKVDPSFTPHQGSALASRRLLTTAKPWIKMLLRTPPF
jgi:hypothetical protein